MEKEIELLPCPFCNSDDVQVWAETDVEMDILPEGIADYDPNLAYPDDNTVMFEIGCMGCDFCTGKFLRPAHVIDKWNRRDREARLVEALELIAKGDMYSTKETAMGIAAQALAEYRGEK